MKSVTIFLSMGLGFLAAAALVRLLLAPLLEQLPANYANVTEFATLSNFRESLKDNWEAITLTGRRVDQTLSTRLDVAMIQGDLYWVSDAGDVLFEATGLYGVDRTTHQNRAEFGDHNRSGQYLFPLHVQPTTYEYWDQNFIGLRTAHYDRTESVEGVATYVFNFTGTAMDETAGYSHLPDVPERYFAHTDGWGALWIEPASGIVVDYVENGVSYFVDRSSGARVGDFQEWSDRFTTQTRTVQLARARAALMQSSLLEGWIPGFLAVIGAALLIAALVMAMRLRGGGTPAPIEEHGP